MTLQTEERPQEETRALTRPVVSPHAVQEVKQEISLLQNLVKSSLTRSIDYGRIPGTPADSLWEPGAAMIINAFNCYAGESRILSMRDDEERISICLEVPLVSRINGNTMATGIGAASTLETKHKYRWMNHDDATQMAFDEATMSTFKTRQRDGQIEYRVPNPEHGELLNTIVKMARKRAEVDAAEALPGVSSALRQMFSQGNAPKGNGNKSPRQQTDNKWTVFWGKVRQMGYTQDEAYQQLSTTTGMEITSIKEDWEDKGFSLERALEILAQHNGDATPEKQAGSL